MISASTLREDIESELEFEPSIHADGIGVAEEGGVVTLTGHVSSYAEKFAAERAAARVKGVRAVVEKIEVQVPFEERHDDAEIARRAANIMEWSVFLPAGTVHVKVEKSWVTLTGDVDWQYQKESAEDGVRKLSGVGGVWNLITIKQRVMAADVRERIELAYRRNAEFDATKVAVAVDGGEITLSGRVATLHERSVAQNAAWGILGVTKVIDKLTVL